MITLLAGIVNANVKQLKEDARITRSEVGTFYGSMSSTPGDTMDDFSIFYQYGNQQSYPVFAGFAV